MQEASNYAVLTELQKTNRLLAKISKNQTKILAHY
jgi:hypothetical protein